MDGILSGDNLSAQEDFNSAMEEISDSVVTTYTLEVAKGICSESEEIEESLKLLKTYSNGKKSAKVYKDSDFGEHRVKHFVSGAHQKDADYHSDDKEDAHTTAKKFVGEGYETIEEGKKKSRLDPKCWSGYKKAGTKMKGDTRVNDCVKIESGAE